VDYCCIFDVRAGVRAELLSTMLLSYLVTELLSYLVF